MGIRRGFISRLNPQTMYNISVTSVFDGVAGITVWEVIKTFGKRPNMVEGFTASCVGPTTVRFTWSAVPGVTMYQLFIWKDNMENLLPTEIIVTNGHILENMESCSTYYFNMVELQGKVMGTPIPTPLIVTTGFNANSPPKFVNVNFRPNDPHQLILSWAAPCPVPDKNLDYQIYLTDKLSEVSHNFVVHGGIEERLWFDIPKSYGSSYSLIMQTCSEDGCSPYTTPLNIDDPVIPYFEDIHQEEDIYNIIIRFTPPILPPLVVKRGRPVYKIWFSKDPTFQEPSSIKEFVVNRSPFRSSKKNFNEGVWFATLIVEVNKIYKSPPAFVVRLDTEQNISVNLLEDLLLFKPEGFF
ncbi:uncharacterized protein LOC118433689 [Folsomia candida]|uniref:uncharacterized protein LOC118433689 n=1 Tax=Folsomia candida TaxID=158441 RepID=UPI0016054F3B|nr:uncharacterized protein LOC118433689 [Folsomia candida]